MLNNIITTVLRREGKIALPSIGIIVKADFDGDTTYLFTPMAVKTDSNIISAIMMEMELSQCDAANVLDCYVDFVRGVIAKNGKYRIQGIGDILCNESNVYYFTPSNNVVTPPVPVIVEEVKKDILENEIVLEEIADSVPEPVEESEELKAERMNERFQSKRLGEIIEGGANKRFYDKVHSQVVSEKVEEIKEEVIKEEIKQEVVPPKRKGLYDIYDKGFKHEVPPTVKPVVAPVATPPAAPSVVESQPTVVVPPVASVSQPVETVLPKKKKTDVVLVVSIIVIIVGLAFIGYFYYMQQTIEL